AMNCSISWRPMGAYFKEELRGAPRLVYAPDHTFSDVSLACISFINLTSVDDVARVFGRPVDPLRFRGNIYFRTDNPWEEKAWIGKHLTVGETRFEVVEGIVRCAATNVDPATAERDGNMPRLLQDAFGENELGVYAKVVDGGKIAVGDTITVG
ncbi:MAG: MOSC domain-containing protein, partial [Pseudomonadota bacterium]